MMRASSGLGPTVLRSSEMGLRNMILRSTAYYVRPRQHVCKWINTGVISNYAISMYNYYRIGCRSVAYSSSGARGLSFRYPLQNSTGSLAYWFMCKTCHMRQYPGDRRCQGPNCRPGVSVWSKKRDKSVLRLLCGELYLTRAPPILRSSFPARSVRRLPLETWTPAPASTAAAAPAPAASPPRSCLRRLPCKRRRDLHVSFAAPAALPCELHAASPDRCSRLLVACEEQELAHWDRGCCSFGSDFCDGSPDHAVLDWQRWCLGVQLESTLQGQKDSAFLCPPCWSALAVNRQVLQLQGHEAKACVLEERRPFRAEIMGKLEAKGMAPDAERRREQRRKEKAKRA